MSNINKTKVVTGEVRLSYVNLWEPKAGLNGGKEKYSVSIIIPKSDKKTIDKINQAIDAAIEEGIGKFGGKKPNKNTIKLPMRDGDTEKDDDAYKNSYFINANSIIAPQIVDRKVEPILDKSEIYSGIYGRVSLNFYAYNVNGAKGISAGLSNVQKLRDGQPLGNRSTASDDFDVMDSDDEFLA